MKDIAQTKSNVLANLAKFEKQLTGVVLPLWLEKGWDVEHGGFHERLDQGRSVDLGYKRLTSTARQLFVFSEWSKQWNQAACARMAHQTYNYLMGHFWDKNSLGWVAKVSTQGLIEDHTHDLYSTAFAIFALARYGKIFSNHEAIDMARKTMAGIDEKMRHPLAGYVTAADRDWKPLSMGLDQNPHMHLLEALQVLNDAKAQDTTIAQEEKVAQLMATVFYDPSLGLLREHFDATGKPHSEKGKVVEPGHQFEWYWLVRGAAQRPYGQTYASQVDRMFDWGVAHGIDKTRGGVHDICDPQGKVTQSTKRIWPTTEFIRAAACRWKNEGKEENLYLLDQQLEVFLKSYLNPAGWNESLDEQLVPTRSDMPVTTSYHLTTCYLDSSALLKG